MKIGIFGDSYADINGDTQQYSWPNLLHKKYNSEVFALCGTSAWWSYENFLKHNHKYDTIIFCHTSSQRWPIVPNDIVGANWDISNIRGSETPEILRKMNEFYFDIFNNNLLRFLNYHIFHSVNDFCRKNNKYLINMTCFETEFETDTDYPIFIDLHKISLNETIVYNNERMLLQQQYLKISKKLDNRMCHMGHKNNKILFDILVDTLENKKMNINSRLVDDYKWETDDESLQTIFGVT